MLALGANMGAALADNNSLNGSFAARAGQTRASEYLQLVPVSALATANGVKVGPAAAQGGSQIFHTPFQHFGYRPVQGTDIEV